MTDVVTMGKDRDTGHEQLWFDCPGCKFPHRIPVSREGGRSDCWDWNGSLEKPTTNPSVKATWTHGEERVHQCCHFFLRDGVIEFCGDCTHELKGKKVPMKSTALPPDHPFVRTADDPETS